MCKRKLVAVLRLLKSPVGPPPHVSNCSHFNTPSLKSTSEFRGPFVLLLIVPLPPHVSKRLHFNYPYSLKNVDVLYQRPLSPYPFCLRRLRMFNGLVFTVNLLRLLYISLPSVSTTKHSFLSHSRYSVLQPPATSWPIGYATGTR